jgi:RNA polymerase sigma-70 factor (ECF subfamily)
MFERILVAVQSDLTDDQRHVVVLRYLEGFNLRETAAVMGMRVTHVKVIQHRALAKIRQALNFDEINKAVSCANVKKLSKALRIR